MDHQLATVAGFNSVLLALFFLTNSLKCVFHPTKPQYLFGVLNAVAMYFTVCDAIIFFKL